MVPSRVAQSRGLCPTRLGVLPIRGVLYTLTSTTALLVAIQVLDGVGAGIFGVVSVLVIADLTRGTGRFNLTLGAISTAVGIGAALNQTIAGSIVYHVGSRAGFLFLAAVASSAGERSPRVAWRAPQVSSGASTLPTPGYAGGSADWM
jgi:MFS family permease